MSKVVVHGFWEGEAPAEPKERRETTVLSELIVLGNYYAMGLSAAQRELRPPKSRERL